MFKRAIAAQFWFRDHNPAVGCDHFFTSCQGSPRPSEPRTATGKAPAAPGSDMVLGIASLPSPCPFKAEAFSLGTVMPQFENFYCKLTSVLQTSPFQGLCGACHPLIKHPRLIRPREQFKHADRLAQVYVCCRHAGKCVRTTFCVREAAVDMHCNQSQVRHGGGMGDGEDGRGKAEQGGGGLAGGWATQGGGGARIPQLGWIQTHNSGPVSTNSGSSDLGKQFHRRRSE